MLQMMNRLDYNDHKYFEEYKTKKHPQIHTQNI